VTLSFHNAAKAPAPVGGYAQAVKVAGATELLFISGQIPVDAAGHVPSDFSAQATLCWQNVFAQLEAASLSREHLVKVTIYLSDRRYAPENRAARQAALGEHPVALTVIISGIFDSAWLLEIEAVAAR
jgi:2-iminobutanoate/2-iminopropanoate deaminase